MEQPSRMALQLGKRVTRSLNFAHALRQRDKEVILKLPNGLVVSSDEYVDVVKLVGQSDTKVFVVVVSRTGEWQEYLTAIRARHLTTWLTRLFLGNFGGSSKILFGSADDSVASKELPFSNYHHGKG